MSNLIIIPTYNEIENIESLIHQVFQTKIDLNILVVDDNSPDGTGDKVYNLINIYSKKLFLLILNGFEYGVLILLP